MKRASNPNASEKEYMNKVAELGCCACFLLSGEWGTPAAIHHVKGSRRTGGNPEPHKEVLGLCGEHHQGTAKKPGGYVHGRLADFEEMFGSQQSLIEMTREYL
jgi:hypothetical protein